tara:strand:+ start:9956 stop:11779 length:1824 start_codon:yes stop_codon:yes gene_type:complete
MLRIQDLINQRNRYKVDYNYQRPNDAWSMDDKQCLIDTILKDEPIPLFFFNIITEEGFSYIVDGQQRINCILNFYDNKIKLNKKYSGVENHGKTFNGNLALNEEEMGQFLNYKLQTHVLENYNDERVRLIFSRLQRGKPLQLGERLNAKPGKIVECMRQLAKHDFLKFSLGVSKNRYGVYPDAARILYYEIHGAKQMGSKEIYDFFDLRKDLDVHSKAFKNIQTTLNVLLKCFPKEPGDYKYLEKHAWVLAVYSMVRELNLRYSMLNQEENIRSFVKEFHYKVYDQFIRDSNTTYQRFFENIRGGWSEKIISLRRDILILEFKKKHKILELDDKRQISDEEKIITFGKAHGKCSSLDCNVIFKDYKEAEYHHVDLYSHGGKSEIKNIQVLCTNCHDDIHRKDIIKPNAGIKQEVKKNTIKKPAVIQSILDAITSIPKSKEDILEELVELFPDKDKDSMSNTIRAQIGRKNQPTRMEEEKEVVFNISYDENNTRRYSISKNSPNSNLTKPAIGALVKEKLKILIDNNLISPEEVIKLQREDYSIEKLHLRYPMLLKVGSNYSSKILRYWKPIYTIRGENFVVCSEWYEQPANNDRPYFLKWCNELKKN